MTLRSWGNYPLIENKVFSFRNQNSLNEILSSESGLIPYGNGRSYGDSALSEKLVHVRPYDNFLAFNDQTGLLHCQAGVLLSEIIDVFLPRGWFLSVTPGTKLITVGGALASDVHGKSHHIDGSFSDSVTEFNLMLPDGSVVCCSKVENRDLFLATCGGMGLTGVILDIKIKLRPVNSVMVDQITIKTANLTETFEAFEKYKALPYSVAWIDCLAKGDSIGRCLLMVGDHSNDGNLKFKKAFPLIVPFRFPSFVLNNFTVRAFNTLFYGKTLKAVSQQKVGIDNFFYPLDAIHQWNNIYGKNGFTQYQFVIPTKAGFEGLQAILGKIADSGKGSFLAVLKQFGKGNDNWLSFPQEGYTLALDFKIEPGLFELLDELDRIVLDYGGRFYLSKDVRVGKETFEKGYENIGKFRELRKKYNMIGKFSSLQSRRLEL
jgi:FAD/FMN-containing dehydrogenase